VIDTSWWEDIVHKYKNCLFCTQFNSLPDHINKLTDCQVSRDQVPVKLKPNKYYLLHFKMYKYTEVRDINNHMMQFEL
jgi:hypothetical protein